MPDIVRVIKLPAIHRTVTIGQYVKAVKLAKANPTATFAHGFTTWWPTTGTEIMRQFRQGWMERCLEAIPYCKRGLS